jgi:N-acetylmuramoyl-L-alanine amidase
MLLSVFATAVSAFAADVPLYDLLEETTTRFHWDSLRRMGRIYRGEKAITFRLDEPRALLDYERVVQTEPAERVAGAVVLPGTFAELVRSHFSTAGAGDPFGFISSIFIDPGHGGRDPGATRTYTVEGERIVVNEKDVVLDVSRLLRDRLEERYPEKLIRLSRDEDIYLTLEQRTEIANEVQQEVEGATLYVSIHANAALRREPTGFEVWFLPPEYRREVLDPSSLSPREREIFPILNAVQEEEYTVQSILLGQSILTGLELSLGAEFPNRGLKQMSWAVVRNARMPAVLVEVGFVTNPKEALLLRDEAHLNRIADGIYTGVQQFIRSIEN